MQGKMDEREFQKWPSELLNYPQNLPIVQCKNEIINALKNNQVVIVTGATGSGKSTQLPKICLEAGLQRKGIIGCTQPRRIAAVSLAQRLSQELKNLGNNTVGYKIRFQEQLSRNTIIKFMTDGILLAEAQSDRYFRKYDVLIIDEAHERSLNIDFILGILRRLTDVRKDISIIISSATINPEKFSNAFDEAPIIEVQSKTYPIETVYLKEEDLKTDEEKTHIDFAKEALNELVARGIKGDILIFMPTEKDIRDLIDQIKGMPLPNMKPYPLYARMASWQQQKIFNPTNHHKIIVATNVAETSLTIPNIKAVIDTGLARIPLYSSKTGTQKLPILQISKASADQRKGRCGRTSPGICIRLYTEEDYNNNMPDFTPPEIRRSSLAEVILRMMHLKLGDVSSFPFLDPPPKTAIKEAYTTLKELGALYEKGSKLHLTKLGKLMAKLPLDPRLSRILLESIKLKAFEEVLVIVSALSIQDPRERPFGQENLADEVHKNFNDPKSDFLTLLKIWHAYHREANKKPSRSNMKKWCKENFISFRRMQEWISIYDELLNIVRESVKITQQKKTATYDSIHKSLLAGFVNRIALHEGKGKYKGTKGKELYIFPGSSIEGNPQWIMAAELVETTRTFARTVAFIEPQWIEEVAPHLCNRTYYAPHWNPKKGNVIAYEKVTFGGLPVIENRPVIYGRIDPEVAHEIFIKEGLIASGEKLDFAFIKHNQQVINNLLNAEEKIRRKGIVPIEEILYQFYEGKIPKSIWSLGAFRRFLKNKADEKFLKISSDELFKHYFSDDLDELFPGHIVVNGEEFPLKYSFSPGSETDGVTVTIPVQCLKTLDASLFDWLIPGYLEEKVLFLIKNLPKDIRRRLIPINDVATKVAHILRHKSGNFVEQLSKAVQEATGIKVDPYSWPLGKLTDHLKFRFEIVDPNGETIASGRNLDELKQRVPTRYEDSLWEEAKARLEIDSLDDFPDNIPSDKIEIGKDSLGRTRYAYLALVNEGNKIALRIFPTAQDAQEANKNGILEMLIKKLDPYLKKAARYWIVPQNLQPAVFFIGTPGSVTEKIKRFIIRDLFKLHKPVGLNVLAIKKTLETLKPDIFRLGQERFDLICKIIERRYSLQKRISSYRKKAGASSKIVNERMDILENELDFLVPKNFLDIYSYDDLKKCIHYLKALEIRIDRAYVSPEKDRAKSKRFEKTIEDMSKILDIYKKGKDTYLKWVIEDLKIMAFAPEIKPLHDTKNIKKMEKLVKSCPARL